MAEELFELSELTRTLQEIAEEVKKVYKGHLWDSDRVASGNLFASVQSEVRVQGTTYEVVLHLQDYWKYVEEDTRPHWPPPDAILRWISVKNIIPRPDDKGRIPKPEQLAFLIGRKISEKGTEGTHDLQHTKEEVLPRYWERIQEALTHDAIIYIGKVMTREFKK